MKNITVVIRVDAGAIIITPEMVEEAINFYLGADGAVTVFHAAQPRVQLTAAGVESDGENQDSGGN